MRRQRHNVGSVRFDKRRGTWNYLYYDHGTRRSKLIGTRRQYPTKAAAWKAVCVPTTEAEPKDSGLLVSTLIEKYKAEKMPQRFSTSRAYQVWFKNYILPEWGDKPIAALQPRPVELWLSSLDLAPKSRSHIRGLLHVVWDYVMWSGAMPVQVNPISLVTVKGSSKRARQPRSLTVEEFHQFGKQLRDPFHTIALLCVCFGLRISECLALKWADVNWLERTLRIERGIVRHRVDDVKTVYSQRAMSIDPAMLEVLKSWKQATQFSSAEDWMFASPARIGRLPWSYDQVWRLFRKAGKDSGVGWIGTHTMRHTYRSWLDAVGTPLAVQQKLMRHADIRTTMNIYGDVVTEEMSQAAGKVTRLALNGAQTERKPT